MMIDLSKLSTTTLKAIRRVLVDGATATASKYADADGDRTLKNLKQENAELRRLNARRSAVEAVGLDWDQDYWMSFSDDGAFQYFLNLFANHKAKLEKELALSERTRSIKVPNLVGSQLNAVDEVRAGFRALRNKRNGTGED